MKEVSSFRLDGEVALITGGATGIGFAVACCMAQAGARVVLAGRNEEALRRAANECGDSAIWERHDVTEWGQAAGLVERVTKRTGKISILVNNAGIHLKKPALQTTEEEFSRVLEVHLLGAFALSRAAAPQMLERKTGSIIFIASVTALMGLPEIAAYSSAKAAQLALVRSLAAEWSPQGIRVNGIATGWTETDMARRVLKNDPLRAEKILSRTPLRRLGRPEDTGWAAVYLASPAAQFITGAVLTVDGGATIGF